MTEATDLGHVPSPGNSAEQSASGPTEHSPGNPAKQSASGPTEQSASYTAGDPPRPHRQERDKATEDIDELAPGVLRSQLPVELPGLGHVNCYILEDERGIAVIDPGLPGTRSFDFLKDRLRRAGYKVGDIHTAIITHSHFDHFGGAEHIRAETDAEVLTHESFRPLWESREVAENPDLDLDETADSQSEDQASQNEIPPWERKGKTPWGTERNLPSPTDMAAWQKLGLKEQRWFKTPDPSVTVVDSEIVSLARRDWIAIHTPGHTGDHLCLWDPEYKLMVSGDHVLPTITPHIAGATSATDPLAMFFDSLRRMREFGDAQLVLPAHGHPFRDLVERANGIIVHHEERLDVIRDVADDLKEAPVEEYMKQLFAARVWGDMAASETYAHLLHLELLGEMTSRRNPDGLKFFARTF